MREQSNALQYLSGGPLTVQMTGMSFSLTEARRCNLGRTSAVDVHNVMREAQEPVCRSPRIRRHAGHVLEGD